MREKVIDKLEKYTEKGGYDTGVITRDNFINLATEIVKLFAIHGVVGGSLPDFLYEYEGNIKVGVHGDSVVTDEWNKWKLGSDR